MANSAGSKKRARQAVVRRARNVGQRSMVRTFVKKVHTAIEAKNYDEAVAAFNNAQPALDSMARKGIIAKNKAARTKSRLNAQIKALKA